MSTGHPLFGFLFAALCLAGCQTGAHGLKAAVDKPVTAIDLPERPPVQFDIDVDPHHQRLSVRASFASPTAPLSLQMPVSEGGVVARGFEARCGMSPVPVEVGEGALVTLDHGGCSSLSVSYQVALPAWGGAFGDRLDASRGLVVFGQSLLAVPSEGQARVGVRVSAPASWEIVSSWLPLRVGSVSGDRAVRAFIAEDYGHLQDAVLAAGRLRCHEAVLEDGRTLRLALSGRLPVSDGQLAQMIEGLLATQGRLLPKGWRWPSGTASLTVVALSGESGRTEGAGRRGGAVIEVGEDTSPIALGELLAHELFHAVNGHLLVHRPEDEFTTLWLKEGVTTWLALLSVVQSGLADEGWFLGRLSEIIQAYYENPLSTKITTEGLAGRFWRDEAARRLPYDKGALLGLLLDRSLAQDGRTGLERLFEVLLEKAARGHAYSQADLKRAALALSPDRASTERFWSRFVEGAEPLPLKSALSDLALRLDRRSVSAPYYGFEVGRDAQGSYIAAVDPDSPAALVGLRPGERLLGSSTIPRRDPGSEARLELRGRMGMRRIVVPSAPGRRVVYAVEPLNWGFVEALGL